MIRNDFDDTMRFIGEPEGHPIEQANLPQVSQYGSVDPTPPSKDSEVEMLTSALAMKHCRRLSACAVFSLTNQRSDEACLALCKGSQVARFCVMNRVRAGPNKPHGTSYTHRAPGQHGARVVRHELPRRWEPSAIVPSSLLKRFSNDPSPRSPSRASLRSASLPGLLVQNLKRPIGRPPSSSKTEAYSVKQGRRPCLDHPTAQAPTGNWGRCHV